MNERTKDFIFYGIMFAYVALSIMVIVKEAKATPPHNVQIEDHTKTVIKSCLLYTSPSPRDNLPSRMPSSA